MQQQRSPVVGGPTHDDATRKRGKVNRKNRPVTLYLRPANPFPVTPPAFSYLSKEAYAAQYSASPDDIAKVEEYLSTFAIKSSSDPLRRSVSISGRRKDIEKAFHIRKNHPASVPTQLKDIVSAIVGLDTMGSPSQSGSSSGDATHWGLKVKPRKLRKPADIEDFYQFPPNTSGKGQCIGVIELGGGYHKKDVNKFFRSLGVKPNYRDILIKTGKHEGKNAHAPKGLIDGYAKWMQGKGQFMPYAIPFFEVTMDLSVIGALAPDADIQMYFGYDTTPALIDILHHALFEASPRPTVLCMSWGFEERGILSDGSDIAAAHVINELFQAAGLMGITVVCAAGDWGASNQSLDGFPGKGLDVEFPASCQYALAVGGTTVTRSKEEVVWNTDFPPKGPKMPKGSIKHGATGGGYSQIFDRSPWQRDVHESVYDGRRKMRAMPDVAALADPRCGMYWRMGGRKVPTGGTSGAAPIWAALIARLNEAVGENIGFANPVFYALGQSKPKCFNAVVRGNNKFSKKGVGYYARKGWNACTGWGTPRGKRLTKALRRIQLERDTPYQLK
jgi:kumamolisin